MVGDQYRQDGEFTPSDGPDNKHTLIMLILTRQY